MPFINQAEFEYHVITNFPTEACGIVRDNVFVPIKNVADNPLQDFKMDPMEYARELAKGVDAIVHSHPVDTKPCWYDRRIPSKADMVGQLNTSKPWGIVTCEGETVSEPLWFGQKERPPLLEREFIFSVQDCLCLARDYFKEAHNIDIPNTPREVDWFLKGEDLISAGWKDFGFVPITKEELQPGDVMLMKIRSDFVNHIAIYIDHNVMLHHLINRLSGYDEINKWDKQIHAYLRHKTLVRPTND